ncbi:MAG: aminoacyl-tRNA hydrolase [Xenococcaceae cyanobacterium]
MIQESITKLLIPELIVGLGNPEPKYDKTRHNIGFELVDTLAKSWQIDWQKNSRFQGLFAEGRTIQGNKIRLLKPLTYMNRSGQSVRAVTDWYKLTTSSVLVIYDDMDLPLGKMRLRMSGSAGGHNGMKSIISHLGKQDFPRLRIGIGKSTAKRETIGHVLGKFSPTEAKVVQEVLGLAEDAINLSLKQGVEKAMSLYNGCSVEA